MPCFLHSCIYLFFLLYMFLQSCIYFCIHVQIKHTLVDSTWGHIDVHGGEWHGMCLGTPFPSLYWGCNQSSTSSIPFRVTISIQVTTHMDRLSHQMWTWHHQSIVWWCTNDAGLSNDDIYVTFILELRGYKRKNTMRKGLPSSKISCVELIGLN